MDGLHNVKKIMPMPDSKIQLFWLLFPTLAQFLAPNHDFHRSLSFLAIHFIANYNFSAIAHARFFQNGGKLAPFSEIRCHCSSPPSLYIHRWLLLFAKGKKFKLWRNVYA